MATYIRGNPLSIRISTEFAQIKLKTGQSKASNGPVVNSSEWSQKGVKNTAELVEFSAK
jgi:hypothetical protein